MNGLWPWAVAMLSAYHGIDPSMVWLFAVALGLQGSCAARPAYPACCELIQSFCRNRFECVHD